MNRTTAATERRPTASGRRLSISLRAGIGLAFATAAISGVAIFVNGYAVKQVPDAAVYTTAKNGIAALVLLFGAAMLIGLRRTAGEPRAAIGRNQALGLLFVGLVGGGLSFLLFFVGLAQATAPGAAFIQKTMFVWVAVLAVPFLGERLGWAQVAAIGLLVVGQLALVPLSGVTWGGGETLIALATIGWSLEIVVARRLLKALPTEVVAIGRMGIGLVVLVGYVVVTGRADALLGLGAVGWGWALLTGLILAGYVGTWYAALRRAPASLVTAILVVAAPLTAALQALGKAALPAPAVIVPNLVLLAGGVALAILALRQAAASERTELVASDQA